MPPVYTLHVQALSERFTESGLSGVPVAPLE